MNFMKSETHVCPDVLIKPVFQVLSDEGQAPGLLLIENICLTLIKHSTPLYSFITPSPYTAVS
jgi:hypothetical protein